MFILGTAEGLSGAAGCVRGVIPADWPYGVWANRSAMALDGAGETVTPSVGPTGIAGGPPGGRTAGGPGGLTAGRLDPGGFPVGGPPPVVAGGP